MAGIASKAWALGALGSIGLLMAFSSCETQRDDPIKNTAPRNMTTLSEVTRPVREPKSGFVTVISDTLTVDLSREIYITDVMKKFADSFHMQTRDERKRPVEEAFKNTSGGLQQPLEFRIHSVRFIVIKSAKFRIHAKGEARFDLVADGHVQIIEKGAKEPRNADSLGISEGVWKETPSSAGKGKE
jgi:hypothetical protein